MEQRGPFQEKSREVKYQNKWMRVEEAQVLRPDGSDGLFGLVYIQGGVVVVALDEQQNVFLAKEYKYAMERETLEVISGGIDSGESVEDAAQRELQEETQHRAKTLTRLGILEPLTTLVSCTNQLVLAQELESAPLEHSGGDVLTISKVPLAEALNMIDSGEIHDGMSVAALLRVERYLNKT